MKKVIKKRSYKFEKLATTMFVFSFIVYLASSLFLHSYNNALSMEIQSTKSTISALEGENSAIMIQIQTLSTKDRVMDIADEAGLELNQTNIISVFNGD